MVSQETCPPIDLVRAVLEGAAAPQEQQRVERHLEQCADCRARLEALAGGATEAADEIPETLCRVIAGTQSILPSDTDFLVNAATQPDLAASDAFFSPVREGPGPAIGRYKLLQLIGEGGFGVVYLA